MARRVDGFLGSSTRAFWIAARDNRISRFAGVGSRSKSGALLEARSALASEAEAIQAILSSVQTRLNDLALPAALLPPEILTLIFRHLATSYPRYGPKLG